MGAKREVDAGVIIFEQQKERGLSSPENLYEVDPFQMPVYARPHLLLISHARSWLPASF